MPNNSAHCILGNFAYCNMQDMQDMQFNMQQYVKQYAVICTKICQIIAHSVYWAYSAYCNMHHMQNMSFNMQLYIKKYATVCTIICHIIVHCEYFAYFLSYYCIYFCLSLHILHILHISCHIAAYFLAYSCIFSCIFCFILAYIFAYCTAAQAQTDSKIQSDQVCATYQRAAGGNLDRRAPAVRCHCSAMAILVTTEQRRGWRRRSDVQVTVQ